jgi:hypothetical protein
VVVGGLVGATVVGATVVGAAVVGATVVGAAVVGAAVVGAAVVGATVVGATVVGATVVVVRGGLVGRGRRSPFDWANAAVKPCPSPGCRAVTMDNDVTEIAIIEAKHFEKVRAFMEPPRRKILQKKCIE